MKNLKLGIFSLLAIFAVSVFLTSCEQDKIALPSDDIQKTEILAYVQNNIEEGEEITFILPAELEGADEETVEFYLDNMNTEQIEERVESYRIENYLESIGRLEKVYKELGQIDLLKQSDLIKYTSEQEFADFNSFDVNSVIESRGVCTQVSVSCRRTNDGRKWTRYRFSCVTISWKGVKRFEKIRWKWGWEWFCF